MSSDRLGLSRQNAEVARTCPESIFNKYSRLGYSRDIIQLAYETCTNPDNENAMIDKLLEYQQSLTIPMDVEKSGHQV